MPKNDDDKELFKTAMRGVKRLIHTKIDAKPIKPLPKRLKQPKEPAADDTLFFSEAYELSPVASESLLYFARPGIQHKILRKLRTGQYNTEAKLDLHGMTVEQAKTALSRFLKACQLNELRYVLIIHGKGLSNKNPILKNKLNNWLRQIDDVLAFSSATLKEGHSGALYVLLRRKQ